MKNINILVIDDSISFLMYIKDLFNKNNYHNIFTAYDVESAKKIIEENRIHVILLDIELKTIDDGLSLGNYIMEKYEIPIILITGKEEEEIRNILSKYTNYSFFYGILFKPIHFSEIEVLIQNAYNSLKEKYIKQQAYKKLIEYILEPSIILFKYRILYYNKFFIDFINNFYEQDIKNLNHIRFIEDIIPELKYILEEILVSGFTEKYNGEIKFQNKKIPIELIPLSENYIQVIFQWNKNYTINDYKKKLERFDFVLGILNKMMEGIFILDSKRNFLFVNSTFLQMFNFREEDVYNHNIKILKNLRFNTKYYGKIWSEVNKKGLWEGSIYSVKKDGEERKDWLYINKIQDYNTNNSYYIGIITDLNKRLEYENHLFNLAHFDELTNLPNKRYFKEILRKEIYYAKRNHTKFAIIFIDIDKFKSINDIYGHLLADRVLEYFAKSLKNTLRKSDFIARYAGDEFCIIINNIQNINSLIPILEKILQITKRNFKWNQVEIPISLSLGIAIYPDDLIKNYEIKNWTEEQIENTIIEIADKKMYEAKKSGGNRYRFFSNELNQYAYLREELHHLQYSICFYLIYNNENHNIGIVPYINVDKEKNSMNKIISKYLESNLDEESIFFNEYKTNLENIKDFIKNKYIYFRFSTKLLTNKKYIEELIYFPANIILELTEMEFLNLLEYHSNYLNYLQKYNINFSIKKNINQNMNILKYLKTYKIFAITPELSIPISKLNEFEFLSLKVFIENMNVLNVSTLIDNIKSKKDEEILNNLSTTYHINKFISYTVEDLKKIFT